MRRKTNTPLIPKLKSGLILTRMNTAYPQMSIPREDIKVLLGNLIEYFTDEESAKDVREGLDTEFDGQVTTDWVYNSYVRISYFNDGCPQEVVSQDNISLGDRQKLTQKYITWDYRSVGHSE